MEHTANKVGFQYWSVVHWLLRAGLLMNLYILADASSPRPNQATLARALTWVPSVWLLWFAGLFVIVAGTEVVARITTGRPSMRDLLADVLLGIVYLVFLARAILEGVGQVI